MHLLSENQKAVSLQEVFLQNASKNSRKNSPAPPALQTILKLACWTPLTDPGLQDFYKDTSLASLMQPKAERTTSGVRMNLAAAIDAFKYFKGDPKDRFSIIKWIKAEDSGDWLFLTALPSQREALAPLLASWCNFAFLGLERLGPSRTRRLWFIVDEFPGLIHKIDALPRMVAEGAKYGACCVLSFQNKSQLDHLYNTHVTKTILSNCNTKMIFRSPETSTAQFLSALLGKQEVFESAESISMGAHHIRDGVNLSPQQRLKPIVSETDIINLNKFEAFVQLPGDLPITKVTASPSQIEDISSAFVKEGEDHPEKKEQNQQE